jgi:hypothetical protein
MSFRSTVRQLKFEYGKQDALSVTTAADFLTGRSPATAEAYDRKGAFVGAFVRDEGEAIIAFRIRVREAARALPGAKRIKLGGIAREPRASFPDLFEDLPRGAVTLPDIPPHPSQLEALSVIRNNKRVALVCGRRWGKSVLLATIAVDAVLAGQSVGLFCPTFKFLGPLVEIIVPALRALPKVSVNRQLGEIRLENGGGIDLWSLDHTARAGRGRKYHLALIDEAAHDEGRLATSYSTSIAPSLLDYDGQTVAVSTPNGLTGWFHDVVHDDRLKFVTYHAPTAANPFLSVEGIAELRSTMPRAEEAAQELDALFVDMAGATIFPLSALLVDGQPHPDDFKCQAIGVAIDSNSGKGGPDRDGCAAVIFGVSMPNLAFGRIDGATCVLIDWDIQSLAQGGFADWIATIQQRTMGWYRRLRPLQGLPKAFIEPMGNAYSIIEAARARGLNPQEIDLKYVSAGKDMRGNMVAPHSNTGRLKIGKTALEKRSNYRGEQANHLVKQFCGYHAFDKDSYRREDDLYDAATYAALVTLGDGNEQRWANLKRVV